MFNWLRRKKKEELPSVGNLGEGFEIKEHGTREGDVEILNYKLDLINVKLDALKQKIDLLERIYEERR